MLPDPPAPGSIPSIPEIFSEEKIANDSKVHQQRCFEESEQWLENVDSIHLVLASGKLVLQEKYFKATYYCALVDKIIVKLMIKLDAGLDRTSAAASPKYDSSNVTSFSRRT